MNNKVIKVYAMKKDGTGFCKAAYWNVEIEGEIRPMYFARKWQALAYLLKRQEAK